jgi:hypothetical protein
MASHRDVQRLSGSVVRYADSCGSRRRDAVDSDRFLWRDTRQCAHCNCVGPAVRVPRVGRLSQVTRRLHLEEPEHRPVAAHADREEVVSGAELLRRGGEPQVAVCGGIFVSSPVVPDRFPGYSNRSDEDTAVGVRCDVAGGGRDPPVAADGTRLDQASVSADGDGVVSAGS